MNADGSGQAAQAAMEARHQRSLFSTYVALQQLAEEMRGIATRGLSPANAAGQMTPLPEAEWKSLEEELRAVLADAREIVAQHAPALLEEHERPRALTHTRSWIDMVLSRAQGLVDDMDPERLAGKYGAIEAPEAAEIGGHITRMREGLAHLRTQVSRKGGRR
jgi:hypothetical protein